MFSSLTKKIFGTANDRIIKSFQPIVNQINALESTISKLTDDELRGMTDDFRSRLKHHKTTLDDILPEAFAVVREASKRILGQRHFDVQLIGGIAMHNGIIAEMRTGEGKTLTVTLPVYLNAITGHGVHVVTINDYLAKRDSEWMGQIYRSLGLSVECIYASLPDDLRRKAYQADITYGTNNEFAFDYLRDNLKYDISHMVQRKFHSAFVDEVDNIFIDEARTPLIISGPTNDNFKLYSAIDKLVRLLNPDDYEIDEKSKTVILTDNGHDHAESLLKKDGIISKDSFLYDVENMSIVHHMTQALKGHHLFSVDIDYIVKDGKVMIIDEFTGRIMDGRRYSDGLHQALEAKEGLKIQSENQTLASITFQNYFRMYPKLAGMTGTAMTEANEFMDIYGLEVLAIPTNIPVQRIDREDIVYRTDKEKYKAIVEEITKVHKAGQPILVGTVSIEKSEYVSSLLKKAKIKHTVLNARYHEQEADIIAQAGRLYAVTIATNMAGRGTDIMLGGNPNALIKEALKAKKADEAAIRDEITKMCIDEKAKIDSLGGLFILGTERHESRRIDNQLRGRAGRQGDKGVTQFYLSMDDDLMRIFGSEKISSVLSTLGLKEGEAITHPWITKSLEKAQQKVEARNYDIRKNLLKYDDVINEQRRVIYEERLSVMTQEDMQGYIADLIYSFNDEMIENIINKKSLPEEWNLEELSNSIRFIYDLEIDLNKEILESGLSYAEMKKHIDESIISYFIERRSKFNPTELNQAEKSIILVTQDQLWKDHLQGLDHLRAGINLRAYAQKDPLNEYKMEAFHMFKAMIDEYRNLSLQRLFRLEISHAPSDLEPDKNTIESRPNSSEYEIHSRKILSPDQRDPRDPNTWGKVMRNDMCPCNSGKKYKSCHGAF